MEIMVKQVERGFWQNKKVFVTGHTGFKGSWLGLWLHSLGASVTGYALDPPTQPNLFQLYKMETKIHSIIGDIREKERLQSALLSADPDIIIHMAAQPLVRDSYHHPVATYEINVMGTVHVLEAVKELIKKNSRPRAVINVTSDKCYENKEWLWGYRETDRMGGYDPYSNSKACSELITDAYRNSFFNRNRYAEHGISLASARAGNVIGGGDWAKDRLVPDCMRALLQGEVIHIRHPQAIRPWQHVLEPLHGYLVLAQKLLERGPEFAEGWNFGPDDKDIQSVEWMVNKVCEKWGGLATYSIISAENLHESRMLKLDCAKAKERLGWYPQWQLDLAIVKTIEWVRAFQEHQDVTKVGLQQIQGYSGESLLGEGEGY